LSDLFQSCFGVGLCNSILGIWASIEGSNLNFFSFLSTGTGGKTDQLYFFSSTFLGGKADQLNFLFASSSSFFFSAYILLYLLVSIISLIFRTFLFFFSIWAILVQLTLLKIASFLVGSRCVLGSLINCPSESILIPNQLGNFPFFS
jgi:hypothetical protein